MGVLAGGDVPSEVSHVMANATTYDCPVGGVNADALVTGYALTVVPAGSAPAGTFTDALAPAELSDTVVDVVDDAVPETGVPKDAAGTPVGGGAGDVGFFNDPGTRFEYIKDP